MEAPVHRTLLSVVLGFALGVSSASAADWAHWRGPTGNGVSPDAAPPTQWSATKNVKWKKEIPGKGSGSPVVWGKQVFVVSAVGTKTLAFKLLCFNADTGDLMWEQTAVEAAPHQGTHNTNSHASASPCTDGEHVYAHFGSRGLYCYTLDGKPVWKRDDFGKMDTRNGFGEGSSPTIAGDKILVPWDHEGPSALYALDKKTGKTLWKADRDEPSNWSTPLVTEHNGVKMVVMNGQKCARAYDLESGKELWRCAGQTQRPAASAVAGHGLVFVGSGFRGSFLGAFDPRGRGDIQGTPSVKWTVSRDTPDVASPLLSGPRLYFFKEKLGVLSCVDAVTGKPHYSAQRIAGLDTIYASPIAAGGHVYLCARNGNCVVIEDSDTFKIVATNSLGETLDATPAPVGKRLYIRGAKNLYCISAE